MLRKQLESLVRRAKAGDLAAQKQLDELSGPLVHIPREIRNVIAAVDSSPLWDRIDLADVVKILHAARGHRGRRRSTETHALIEKLAALEAAGKSYRPLAGGNEHQYARLRKFRQAHSEEISLRAAQLLRK